MSNIARRYEENYIIINGISTGIYIPVSTTIINLDSTNVPLLASASYTSAGYDVTIYNYVTGTVFADQPGLLTVQFSQDGGTNYDAHEPAIGYVANTRQGFSFDTIATTARIVFTNTGLIAQTVFRLYLNGKL